MQRWLKAFPAGICVSALAAFASPGASAALHAPAAAAASTTTASITQGTLNGGAADLRALVKTSPSLAKLDNSLLHFKQAYDNALATGDRSTLNLSSLNSRARVRYESPLAAPSVLVDVIVSGDAKIARAQLEQLGFKTSAVFRDDIGGWMPVDRAADAAALGNLRFVKTAMMHTRATTPDPVAYEGDYVQRSFFVRQANPALIGTGVTVGLISDSFNCAAVDNATSKVHIDDYADDVALGALPVGVNVIKEDPATAAGPCPGTDEGRALAQIIYAIAPGAQIAFYTADGSEADFAQGILTLALPSQYQDPNGLTGGGAQIIDDDVGYFDEPIYQEGEVGLAIDQVASGTETVTVKGTATPVTFAPVAYFSSAGNEGTNSYENLAPQFTGTPATGAPNAGETILNMDTSAATQTYYLPITIPPLAAGDAYVISLFWDQPYQTSTGTGDAGDVNGDPGVANGPGAASVMDICIGDSSGNVPSTGQIGAVSIFDGPLPNPTNCAGPSNLAPNSLTNDTGSVPGDKDPYNLVAIVNTSGAVTQAINASIVVGLVSGPIPTRVKVLIQDDGRGTTINKFATNSPTIQGHPLSPNAMAVGATWWDQAPLCDTAVTVPILEFYSSIGGDPFLFNTSGAALATPIFPAKPDIVAPDGISTTFFGFAQAVLQTTPSTAQCQLGKTYAGNEFFGTSAAAPHAAATAALMLQAYPNATPGQIYSSMRFSALSMNTPAIPAFNYVSGYGFLQADAAMTALNQAMNPPSTTGGTGGASNGGSGAFAPVLLLPGLLLAGLRLRRRRRG
jgi:hypothetical protein